MWQTPTTMDSFILYELKKVILFAEWCHMGSIPHGYGPFSSLPSSARLPNMSMGTAKHSLYKVPT